MLLTFMICMNLASAVYTEVNSTEYYISSVVPNLQILNVIRLAGIAADSNG